MNFIHRYVSAITCFLLAILTLYLVSSLVLSELVIKTLIGVTLNEHTNKSLIAWKDVSISAKALDYSSYAFGIVSLPIAAVSVYLALAAEGLEKVSMAIFEISRVKFGSKQDLIDFIKKPRLEKDADGNDKDKRNSDLKLLAVHYFYSENVAPFEKETCVIAAYGKVLFFFCGRREALAIALYALVVCGCYFSMPILYYFKSEYILHILFFIYISSFLIFVLTLWLYYQRNKIINYWKNEIPIWMENVKNAKAALEINETKSEVEDLTAAIGQKNTRK